MKNNVYLTGWCVLFMQFLCIHATNKYTPITQLTDQLVPIIFKVTPAPLVIMFSFTDDHNDCIEQIADATKNKAVCLQYVGNSDLMQRYSITTAPTVAIFNKEELIETIAQWSDTPALIEKINKILVALTDKASSHSIHEQLLQAIQKQYSLDRIKQLLDAGADPNYKNEQGITPLMFIVMNPGTAADYPAQLLQLLLSCGALPAFTDIYTGTEYQAYEFLSKLCEPYKKLIQNYESMMTVLENSHYTKKVI